jgi:hypothetical protein
MPVAVKKPQTNAKNAHVCATPPPLLRASNCQSAFDALPDRGGLARVLSQPAEGLPGPGHRLRAHVRKHVCGIGSDLGIWVLERASISFH